MIVARLARRLRAEFEAVEVGHCLRVEPMRREDALATAEGLRELVDGGRVEVWVLGKEATAEEITTDRAIEIRNRKGASLCLFVPAELQDAALSSLGNSFAVFDLIRYLQELADELRSEIPDELQPYVRALRSQLRRSSAPPLEDEIDYYSSLLADPTPTRAGEKLWRIGLVPDLQGPNADNYSSRLERNRECMDRLLRPRRAQASLHERVASLGLEDGPVRERLMRFLSGRRLQTDRQWLSEILEEARGQLTFELWRFPEVEPTDLEVLEAEPFLDEQQCVRSFCKLLQDAPGTQLYAECGPGKVVVVKWHTVPSAPKNVAHWRVELVPCPDEYDTDQLGPVDLPVMTVKKGSRTARVPLDLEVEDLEARRVNAVITPLDENGYEIRDAETDEPVSAWTLDFWLAQASVQPGQDIRRRTATVRCLPEAYLSAALNGKGRERAAQPLAWEEKDLWYFPVLTDGRTVHRVGVSRFARDLQEATLEAPETGGRYGAATDGVSPLEGDDANPQPIEVTGANAEAWQSFLRARQSFFRSVRKQETRGLIETVDVNDEFVARARAYARAYLAVLRAVTGSAEGRPPESEEVRVIREVTQVDTLHIEYTGLGQETDAMVVLPTHPLRVYWYLAHAELLQHFESCLYECEPRQRKALLSEANLKRLRPQNFPAFVPGPDGRPYLYAADIGFFHGLALSPDQRAPIAQAQEVSRSLGYHSEAMELEIGAERLAEKLAQYLETHPYIDELRLNVVNPGDGTLVRDTVLRLFKTAHEGQPEPSLARVDIVTHAEDGSIQPAAPGLDELIEASYQDYRPGTWSHLHPMVQVARRTIDTMASLPGHDTHVALCLDHFRPEVVSCAEEDWEEGASAYGLVARFRSLFDTAESHTVWSRAIAYGDPVRIERHPVAAHYTTELVGLHRAYLEAIARLLGSGESRAAIPCVRLDVGPEATRLLKLLHDRADWVLTIDRHFGVEYYDAPANPDTARNAERYLLDYVPEFMEGMGRRLILTTAWRGEVAGVLRRGLEEMALSSDPESCRLVMSALNAVSGRLALRLVRDTPQEKEAVSLAVLVQFLRSRGDLKRAFLVPVDAHPELIDWGGASQPGAPLERCDLMRVSPGRRLRIDFIEVKYRTGELGAGAEGALLDRIADQTQRTEEAFRAAYGCAEDDVVLLDQAIRRAHLANVFSFYLERAKRHGLVNEDAYDGMRRAIQRVEVEMPPLDIRRIGYVVSPSSEPRPKLVHRATTIHFLGRTDVEQTAGLTRIGFSTGEQRDTGRCEPQDEDETPREEPRTAQEDRDQDGEALTGSQAIAVTLGERIGTGEPCLWEPSTVGSPHIFIVGIPGQGKSVTVQRIVQTSVQQGLRTLALDFHGELARQAGRLLPEEHWEVVDASEGLPFSPFEAVGDHKKAALYWQANAFSVAEIVGWVCDLGEIQQDLVYQAIRNCYQSSFVEADEPALPTPEEVFAETQRLEEAHKVRNVTARVRPLFDVDFELFRPAPGLSLYDLVRGLCVVDLHSLGQETLQLAAGAFLLRKVYKDMLQWSAEGELRLLLVLDEAHRLARDLTLPKIMKEGRKFGIVVAAASQGLSDFHADVLGNAGTKVVFRVNYPDSHRVAGLVRMGAKGGDTASRIEQLPVGRAVVSVPEGDEPWECAMLPPDAVE